ncbi:hypothetical protein B0H19DRAFT_1154475 [Mycena capillaripes]|nr:hypothetical protein B0H19DRAFT_1154475 [Mycena capillaripes]
MLTLSLPAALLLSATGNMATQSHSRTQRPRSAPNQQHLEEGDQFVGMPMTCYLANTGLNACTGKNHLDSDWVCSLFWG